MSSFNRAGVAVHLAIASFIFATLCSAEEQDNPAFDANGALLRPANFREWIFVGSSLGLRYDEEVGNAQERKSGDGKELEFKNVYINPAAYRVFRQQGTFPDGTILLLDIAKAETKKEPGLQGSFEKEFVRLEAAVKDSKRFKDGWAYFSFSDRNGGGLKSTAQPFPKRSCFDCHHTKAATDNVFTQFYPVLRLTGTGGKH